MELITIIKYGLNFFELAACITGFMFWNKLKKSYWKYFPIYLAVILLTEIAGKFILLVVKDSSLNTALYSYFGMPVQFFFFFWLFYRYFKNTSKNKWPLFSAIIYFICAVIDLIYAGKMNFFVEAFSYTVGNLLLLVLILMFFIEFINTEEILRYRSSMMFWVCLGLMVFYIGSMPFYGLRNTLFKQHPKIFYPYWYIQYGLDYLMYLFFSIAFIWGKPK
jgi:hypothetical protein